VGPGQGFSLREGGRAVPHYPNALFTVEQQTRVGSGAERGGSGDESDVTPLLPFMNQRAHIA
jgi:hypothetical protein